MKKFLSLLTVAFCLSLSVKAQSTQSSSNTSDPTVLQSTSTAVSAGEAISSDSNIQTSTGSSKSSKSCCSAGKMNESSAGNSKSCCKEGKKNEAHCSDKKSESTPEQENKSDKK